MLLIDKICYLNKVCHKTTFFAQSRGCTFVHLSAMHTRALRGTRFHSRSRPAPQWPVPLPSRTRKRKERESRSRPATEGSVPLPSRSRSQGSAGLPSRSRSIFSPASVPHVFRPIKFIQQLDAYILYLSLNIFRTYFCTQQFCLSILEIILLFTQIALFSIQLYT